MAAAAVSSTSAWADDRTVMVGVDGPVSAEAVRSRIASVGGAQAQVRCFERARLCIARLPVRPSDAVLSGILALDGVRYVERDRLMPVAQQALTGDYLGTEDCTDPWEHSAIGLSAAADLGLLGAGAPVVAIQDTGFLQTHEDFGGSVSGQFDYGDVDTVPEVEWSAGIPHHGTFIAGILTATPDNGLGRAGLLPQGRLNLQKIADGSGALYFSYAVAAMADLADGDLGVRVLSYSIGGSATTAAFDDAVDALGRADILLVAAAGNCGEADCYNADNDRYDYWPANHPGDHVVAVAGAQRDGALNPWSHYGSTTVDLAAPGVDICSFGVATGSTYYTAGGTSYATPIVAGVAALMWERWPELTAVEVARVLRASAAHHPGLEGKVRSDGAVNVQRALSTAVPRLDAVSDVVFEGSTSMGLDVFSVAAEGEAVVVLEHPDGVMAELDADTLALGWESTRLSPGDAVVLPDAGEHTATTTTTVLSGPLPARTTLSVGVVWTALEDTAGDYTARLVAVSEGADYLNAPYDAGVPDGTGFLAYSGSLSATYLPPVDDTAAPVDSGDPVSPEPSDSGTVDTEAPTTEDPAQTESPGSDKGGCSTVFGGVATGWGALAGLWAVGRRRRS